MMLMTGFEKIEKEKIENLRFPNEEVLTNTQDVENRRHHLDRALSLGNLEHSKIKIFFEDDTSCKYVETTVWGITDTRVILKQGIVIPIHRVHSVES
jgi:hypothetical protein